MCTTSRPQFVDYGSSIRIGASTFVKYGLMALDVAASDNIWLGGGIVLACVPTAWWARAVLTKDVPANVAAVGNPARVIRAIDQTAPGDSAV